MNSGADSMSLTSSVWYYERGDKNGQAASYSYPTSDLPCAKVCIAGDANGDGDIDWNDGALAFRDIMNIAQGADDIKDLVNYRIVMNFAGMATNPYLETADNIKKYILQLMDCRRQLCSKDMEMKVMTQPTPSMQMYLSVKVELLISRT